MEHVLSDNFIRVSQRSDDMWAVVSGPRGNVLLAFNMKAHAIAYARAVSSAGKLKLFVDDRYGIAMRQPAASLTYPVWLD
jgi:hypothetical protein